MIISLEIVSDFQDFFAFQSLLLPSPPPIQQIPYLLPSQERPCDVTPESASLHTLQ